MHEAIHPSVIGFIAVVAGIVIFYGSVYALVALNTGWRFGYWLTGATFGGLFIFLSIFWLNNGVGPRGEDPLWIPLSFSQGQISSVEFSGKVFAEPASYPGSPWSEVKDPKDPMFLQVDQLKSATSTCLGYNEKTVTESETELATKLEGWERTVLEGKFHKKERLRREIDTCKALYESLPQPDTLPQFDGTPVTVTYDISDVRFAKEQGTLLGMAKVTPNTYDPRVTGDPNKPKAVGPSFVIVAYRDPGSLKYPAMVYLTFSALWFAFHLWGLSRAERRKLSPVAA